MIDISCSIVLYHNTSEELRPTVESFLNCGRNVKLYLIDNSADDSLRYQFVSPQIQYIFNDQNIGYGAGHNIAIKLAKGKSRYHLILNPDVEFKSDILDELFNFMQVNTDVGQVMPKVLYRNGDTQYLCKRLPAPSDLFIRRFIPKPFKLLLNDYLSNYELRNKNYDTMMEVPNLSGCFMFIRTSVFDSIGSFDERYFMYLEDTDLCRRINKYYRTVYYPSVHIIHGYQKGSYNNLKLMLHHLQSGIRYFNKWGWFGDRNRMYVNRILNHTA